MKAIAMIGAGFGDEGKGRMVDHFAAKLAVNSPAVVVRYNGGAQAGHTVVTPEGKRHVFSHFGAGSFVGASTFLSHFFVVNPFLFMREAKLLSTFPRVYIDPNAILTTPWDMLINRAVEDHRGNDRHGSCGYGVNETVERCQDKSCRTLAADMVNIGSLAKKLDRIFAEWLPKRLSALGIKNAPSVLPNDADRKKLIDEYITDCQAMNKLCFPMLAFELGKRWQNVIFEGAQGLSLHESHRFFPHVTRSKTGIENVETICRIAKIEKVEAVYVTRAYATRHGAGPFPTHDANLSYTDETNAPNEWQGTMRFGCLDVDLLIENIAGDFKKSSGISSRSLAITCLDQVENSIQIHHRGERRTIAKSEFPVLLKKLVRAEKVYLSESPFRR